MSQQPERFFSLDVFRGMTICFMIIVNTPGAGASPFAPLLHADWHGFTPTDLVFPSFLFAVGTAMSFSHLKLSGKPEGQFWAKVLRRALAIFLIGFFIHWFPFFKFSVADGVWHFKSFDHVRFLGVLQRIALCYLLASLLVRRFKEKGVTYCCITLLLLYWAVIYLFGEANDPLSMAGNAGTALDRFLLGETHMYHGEGQAFEPEGLLGTLPAVVNVLIGFLAGNWIIRSGKSHKAVSGLCVTGTALIIIAIVWHQYFPLNKKLWTSSFVLLCAGIDLAMIGLLLYVFEVEHTLSPRWGLFFEIFGRNPLFIYILADILIILCFTIRIAPDTTLFRWLSLDIYQAVLPGPWGSFAFALSFMMLCWIAGLILYKKKICIKV